MIDKFIIGIIGAPFGVKGFVKVRSCSGETGHLLKLKSVKISKDGNEKILQIEESAVSGDQVMMKFEGIGSPEEVKTLGGSQLLAGRDQAAALSSGEFYIEDLKNLIVVTVTGESIGNITDVIEGGGGELVEIKLLNGEKRLVPFRKEFFTEINPDKNRVVLQNLWVLD
ncbi:MAG: ribosome maturation factor RimM [Treponema sp.]|nr:ribosome maturation factor RimM [Treponema sp.]